MQIISKLSELRELCIKFKVDQLYVFGSMAKNNANSESDIDFLVKFGQIDLDEYFDNYMDLKEELTKLFTRNIDLLEMQTVKNPILKKAIDRDKIKVYEREGSQMAL